MMKQDLYRPAEIFFVDACRGVVWFRNYGSLVSSNVGKVVVWS